MHKITFPLILSFAAFINASTCQANNAEQNQAMFTMMMNMAENSPDNEVAQAAKCLGTSKAKLDTAFKAAMTYCFEKNKNLDTPSFMAALESCSSPAIEKETGFTKAQLDKCESDEEQAEDKFTSMEEEIRALKQTLKQALNSDASDLEISKLEEKIYVLEEQLYDLQDQESADFQNANMAPNMAMIEQQLQAVSKASEKTVHLITLPIYSNSQVLMHSFMMPEDNPINMLPAATFASSDKAETIIAFYQKNLPDFNYKNLGHDTHIFMKDMPKGFDILTHMDEYMSTPHILISPASGGDSYGAATNSQTKIEIAYKARN